MTDVSTVVILSDWQVPLHDEAKIRRVAGMEVGPMMSIVEAEYLGPARRNNWGNAFGILRIYRPGKKKRAEVYPELVPITPDGHFVVD